MIFLFSLNREGSQLQPVRQMFLFKLHGIFFCIKHDDSYGDINF